MMNLVIGQLTNKPNMGTAFICFKKKQQIMKLQIYNSVFVSVLLLLTTWLPAQNVGIGTPNPTRPLSFPALLGKKISLYPGATGDAGFGVFANELRIHSDYSGADVTFGYDTYPSTFTELMRIKGNGNVGIGTISPVYKLDVAGRARLRHEGGANTAGLWFNKSDNTASTFAGMVSDTSWGLYQNAWKFVFNTNDGNLGISSLTPQYPLTFQSVLGDKISLYGGGAAPNADHYGLGIQGSLMQLFTPGSTSDIVFGYGRSAAFTERMRIKGNGDVGIGTWQPTHRLEIISSTSALLKIENSTGLGPNLNADFFFKLGAFYSGGIRSLGQMNAARLGFFTGANAVSSNLLERMTILNNGDVGIGIVNPLAKLHVAGVAAEVIGYFENNTSSGVVYGISANANNAGVGDRYGVFGLASGGGSTNTGGNFTATGGISAYGVAAVASGSTYNHGVDCSATGGTIAYGIYSEASGGSTSNFAGYFSGNVYTTGLYQSSDRKLKTEIKPLQNAIATILSLRPSEYKYATTKFQEMHLPEGMQYGLIADEVMQVIPGAVQKAFQPAQYENHDSVNGRKLSDAVEFDAVNYVQMIPILIGAIQEQQIQIDALKQQNATLQSSNMPSLIEQQKQIAEQQIQIDELISLLNDLKTGR